MTELIDIVCPTCFETFGVASPSPEECPCEVDYDCEICCRPMILEFWEDAGEIQAHARGIED